MCYKKQDAVLDIPDLAGHVTMPCIGDWNIIMRHQDDSLSFNQDWQSYKEGFGDPSGDYWIGNQVLYYISTRTQLHLRIDMWTHDNEFLFAEYNQIIISDEDNNYAMQIMNYLHGTSGDGFLKERHNNQPFTTFDR